MPGAIGTQKKESSDSVRFSFGSNGFSYSHGCTATLMLAIAPPSPREHATLVGELFGVSSSRRKVVRAQISEVNLSPRAVLRPGPRVQPAMLRSVN